MKNLKMIGLYLISLLMLSGCSGLLPQEIEKIPLQADVYTFSDGESVSTWQFPDDRKIIYCLSDGTELLATRTMGPEHCYIGLDREHFEDLPQEVRDNILRFYEEEGSIYDLEEYLEKAYAEYTAQENRDLFRCYFLDQTIFLSASNEEVVHCTTTAMLPLNHKEYSKHHITYAFDRKTGDLIDD